jgi:hypothetical protein
MIIKAYVVFNISVNLASFFGGAGVSIGSNIKAFELTFSLII